MFRVGRLLAPVLLLVAFSALHLRARSMPRPCEPYCAPCDAFCPGGGGPTCQSSTNYVCTECNRFNWTPDPLNWWSYQYFEGTRIVNKWCTDGTRTTEWYNAPCGFCFP